MMPSGHDHLLRAHYARSIADLLEREPTPVTEDMALNAEIAMLRAAVVAEFRRRADEMGGQT